MRRKAEKVPGKLRDLRLDRAARIVAEGCDKTLTYYDFPSAHWRNLRTNNPGMAESGNPAQNVGGRNFPGRPCRAHAGERVPAVHG